MLISFDTIVLDFSSDDELLILSSFLITISFCNYHKFFRSFYSNLSSACLVEPANIEFLTLKFYSKIRHVYVKICE